MTVSIINFSLKSNVSLLSLTALCCSENEDKNKLDFFSGVMQRLVSWGLMVVYIPESPRGMPGLFGELGLRVDLPNYFDTHTSFINSYPLFQCFMSPVLKYSLINKFIFNIDQGTAMEL